MRLTVQCDFCGVVVPSNDKYAHRMFIMVNQIPFGKQTMVKLSMEEQLVNLHHLSHKIAVLSPMQCESKVVTA
jgi:hypothetical protein